MPDKGSWTGDSLRIVVQVVVVVGAADLVLSLVSGSTGDWPHYPTLLVVWCGPGVVAIATVFDAVRLGARWWRQYDERAFKR